ncbi:MAG: transglycosylase domain-containing protein [Rickettsiales bacterium]
MSDKKKKPGTKKRRTGGSSSVPRNVSYRANSNYKGKSRRVPGRFRAWVTRQRWWGSAARVFMACFIMLGLALVYFASQLPDIRDIDTIKKQQGITIESVDGHILANYGDVYGTYVPYDQLPKALVLAVIATEDRRFFEHHGVDFFGIARAIVTNFARGHTVQGGSTVTQQVAKNVFLTPERTLKRKLQEVILAFWLEARFTKKEIMAIYLNRVYLGGGAFGVDAAAHRYYNKGAKDLNLYESAMMAGLLKAPSRYSPSANVERSRGRVNQVLLNMVDAGFLKQKDVAPTLANYEKSPTHEAQGGDIRYYTDWIVDEIPNVVGQVEEDMIVTVGLDAKLQSAAQDALQNDVAMQGMKKNVSQGALVAMKPDGLVVAMVGGLDYAKSQFNRAAQAKRQPGSVFKLFVYLAALEAGLSPQSTVEDAPISLRVGNKTWSPDNYEGGNYRGQIPMYQALRHSLNTVSVRLGQYAGFSNVAQMAMRLGVPNIPSSPSIVLGSVEATLLELTGGYAHLANGGNRVEPYGILKVRTRDGREIYKHEPLQGDARLSQDIVQQMNYMLLDVVAHGTAIKAGLAGRPAAGKTGTSQDFKDAWFIGFTQQLVAGVWVGNDDNKPMKKITGGTIPAVVWHDFMIKAMAGQKVQSIPNSAGESQEFLPWLFGSSTDGEDGERQGFNPDGTGEAIPDDVPFSRTKSAPASDDAEPANMTEEPHAKREPAALSPEFWDKLADKVPENPEKGKIEHTYPGADHR